MASLPLLLLAALTAPDQTASPTATPFHDYQQRIADLLKRESQSKTQPDRATTVAALCRLHAEIVHDSRYETSDVLKEYRSRVWSRLTKIKTELKGQLARQSWGGPLAGRASDNPRSPLATLQTLESATEASITAADALAYSLHISNELHGGPAPLLTFGGAPGSPDWGPDLVELIERTINPAFWNTVGGPGTIIYYRPLQCLVISATAEVHGNLNNLIGGLRK